MREELEMLKAEASRRAAIELRSVDARPTGAPNTVIVALGLFNSGSADATGAVINLVVPTTTTVAACSNERGDNARLLSTLSTPEDLAGVTPSAYTIDRADLIRTISFVAFYRLEFGSAGAQTIQIKVGHPLADPVSADATFVVS